MYPWAMYLWFGVNIDSVYLFKSEVLEPIFWCLVCVWIQWGYDRGEVESELTRMYKFVVSGIIKWMRILILSIFAYFILRNFCIFYFENFSHILF